MKEKKTVNRKNTSPYFNSMYSYKLQHYKHNCYFEFILFPFFFFFPVHAPALQLYGANFILDLN